MTIKRKIVEQMLSEIGIQINGPDRWDIQVQDDRFYIRVLKDGSLGLGESYMEGWWDCPRIAFVMVQYNNARRWICLFYHYN